MKIKKNRWENLLAMTQITIAIFIYFFMTPIPPAPYVMWTTASLTFTMSTFIWTAPITMRNNTLRWLLMLFQSKVLCGFGGETRYMTGTNDKGYLFHFTANRAIKYNYVTPEQVRRCSFSIVRNPYSRMVSMYEYNKRPFESFSHFVRAFHHEYWHTYIGRNTTECKYVYCHVLPMFEYTHKNGEQIVSCVIKQEHLKNLVATDWEGSNVPEPIQRAMTGIPHANKRSRKVAWQRYFTQETMDLTYEMYHKDFEIFGYDIDIPGRPDISVSRSVLESIRQDPSGAMRQGSDVDVCSPNASSGYARVDAGGESSRRVAIEVDYQDDDLSAPVLNGDRQHGEANGAIPTVVVMNDDAEAIKDKGATSTQKENEEDEGEEVESKEIHRATSFKRKGSLDIANNPPLDNTTKNGSNENGSSRSFGRSSLRIMPAPVVSESELAARREASVFVLSPTRQN